MGKLIYSITTSLDGFVADEKGNFDFTEPSEEILLFTDDILKNVGTFLFGRHLYDTMAVWDTITNDSDSEGMNRFVDIWNKANKIIYSTSLIEVTTANTTLEHEFDAEKIRQLVTESDKDFDIGGPHLAAAAIKAGIVNEYHQFIVPKILGGGNHWLPKNIDVDLKLVDLQRFENGTVRLLYIPKGSS